MNKTALIVGGTGQFGFYFAKFLLQRNIKYIFLHEVLKIIN